MLLLQGPVVGIGRAKLVSVSGIRRIRSNQARFKVRVGSWVRVGVCTGWHFLASPVEAGGAASG